MIVGLTGLMASGKGEAVNILVKNGFSHITLSDMLRDEAKKQGLEESRENLQELGNKMRSEQGAGVLAIKALETIGSDSDKNWVIDGIRNPAEIDELKKASDVKIIGIHADKEVLVNRILSRKREGVAKSREEVEALIDKGLGVGQPEDGQQVGKCMQIVDHFIVNEGTLEDLEGNVLAAVKMN
jgi:dephospho-CoA kinase